MYTATYSPQDNKLRLYAMSRLDEETYAKVKAAGFIWAPKQECFVAPMWTPEREDLLLTLADTIEDEDSTMEERAEQRAERFSGYSAKRAADAQRAYETVQAISEGIPLGQPILVGHHSEKRARKDAERIENGMRKTIKLFETSEYWQYRAQASLRHAKYKERADVRYRRRKGLEADARRFQRDIDQLNARIAVLSVWPMTEQYLLNLYRKGVFSDYQNKYVRYDYETREYSLIGTPEEVQARLVGSAEKAIAHYTRWLNHTNNRIAYETEMLQGWEPPKKERVKRELSPLVNFKTEGCIEMTAAEWKRSSKCSDAYQCLPMNADGTRAPWRTPGAYRQRHLCSMMRNDKPVFIVDMPVKMPPAQEVENAG